MVTATVTVKTMGATAMRNTLTHNISTLKQIFIQVFNRVNPRTCICNLKKDILLTRRVIRRWDREGIKQNFMHNNNLNMVVTSKYRCQNHIKAQPAWVLVNLTNLRWE